ncbi:MAG: TIM barrel protein [Erysipelothrix sp.]|nr:TIM barrel protein [Erysipelothrix sp.]
MNKSGLVSITFRQLSVEDIIKLCVEHNLSAIEWGADQHILPTDLKQAKHVKKLMDQNNLISIAYGSYYRVGIENEYAFEDILKVATILDVTDIRVWAGRKGSEDVDEAYYNHVIKDFKRISNLAQKENIRISVEYHGKTLTDTADSALKLIQDINHDNVKLYWQPAVNLSVNERLNDLKRLLPYISNVHVFAWQNIEREPLKEQVDIWLSYRKCLDENLFDEHRYYLLEFVKDDAIEQFVEDSKTLNEILKTV